MQNLVHTNAKHWTQKNDSRKTEITPHEINPEEGMFGLALIIRERLRLSEMQNLVHANAKLAGTVEKVFVHEP